MPTAPLSGADCIQLVASQVPEAFALSSIAGWNQTPEDWRMLLDLSDACYGIEVDGQLVATATLICYGQTLAWIGMVLTHPDFRRRGFARKLVGQAMRQAKRLGIQTVKLDATDEGRPLYESFGFRSEQPVERWQLLQSNGHGGGTASSICQQLSELDTFGCDRSRVLRHLAGRGNAVLHRDGYVLDRPGRLNRCLGPCVATNRRAARSLIEEAIARQPETGWFWDLLPANDEAVAIAQELGFERVRRLTCMSWGREFRAGEEKIFAIAGLELG